MRGVPVPRDAGRASLLAPERDALARPGLGALDLLIVEETALALLVGARDAAAGLVLRDLLARHGAVLLALLRLGDLLAVFLRRVLLLLLALAERLLLLRGGLRSAVLGGARCGGGGRGATDGGRLRIGGARNLRVHGPAALDALVHLRVDGKCRR